VDYITILLCFGHGSRLKVCPGADCGIAFQNIYRYYGLLFFVRSHNILILLAFITKVSKSLTLFEF
jgi:hypothetical protein